MIQVRAARAEDTAAIGEVQVASWRAAYQAVMPAAELAALAPAKWVEMWSGVLARARPAEALLVAELGAVAAAPPPLPAVIGFCAAGAGRRADEAAVGEVYALYVHPETWRRGAGGALLEAALGWLRARGFQEAVLWVVADNTPARAFYERRGWVADGARDSSRVLGADVSQCRYRRALASALQ